MSNDARKLEVTEREFQYVGIIRELICKYGGSFEALQAAYIAEKLTPEELAKFLEADYFFSGRRGFSLVVIDSPAIVHVYACTYK